MIALLYPLAGLFAPIGRWRWSETAGSTFAAAQTSIVLTAFAMAIVVVLGTPIALYLRRCNLRERLLWQALMIVSVLLPPLALGLLLSLAFGPNAFGTLLARAGIHTANSATAFVATQVYVSIGYYVLAAVAAFDAVPKALEHQAALLGVPPWRVFLRVTLPLAQLGLAVALSLAWVRALGEFGAVVVTAYYPAGMPVQLWVDLESYGLPAVMPLLVVFLVTALPLPWLAHVVAQRRHA